MAQHIETREQMISQIGLAKKAVADLEAKWQEANRKGTTRAGREALQQMDAGRRYRDDLVAALEARDDNEARDDELDL